MHHIHIHVETSSSEPHKKMYAVDSRSLVLFASDAALALPLITAMYLSVTTDQPNKLGIVSISRDKF